MAVFCFVLEHHLDVKAAAKEIVVRPIHVMVEMAGVEPASESISTGISPSAADDLSFAFLSTRQQVHKSASPLFPDKAGLTCQVFLYGRCQIPYLQVNMG